MGETCETCWTCRPTWTRRTVRTRSKLDIPDEQCFYLNLKNKLHVFLYNVYLGLRRGVPWLLERVAVSLKRLFHEGLTVRGTCYTFALIAVKGDQKWHIAIANLVRHYGTRGRKRSLEMCYECGAGAPNVPYEDVRSSAKWRRTCYRTRPWMEQPPLAVVPFEGDRAEYLYKRDVFHIMRLGLLRHWVGSALVSLIQWGQTFSIEGEPNNADIQLTRAHSSFKLYCLAVRKTPALRSFSRNLFNWPNTSTAPWANVKASDCVLLANWLVSLLPIFAEEHDERERLLLLQMRDCGQHALDFYQHLLGHGLLLCRSCVAESLRSGSSFLKMYHGLAYHNMQQNFAAWAMVPKVHSFDHWLYDFQQFLEDRTKPFFVNPLCFACEIGEDLIGRVCRLVMMTDTRHVTKRVLEFYLVKSMILWKRAAPRLVR